jgi:SPP1 family predicted phage head-tail adaptor
MTQIGHLRHRLTIEMVTSSSKSAYGRRVFTRGDLGKVWGSVAPLSGREQQVAAQTQSRATHKITIRHRENVRPHTFIVHDGRRFEIESVLNREERGQWLDIMAIEST